MAYTHGTQWTDEKIKQRILEVVDVLKIGHMPTRSDIFKLRYNDPLHNGICRHGGYDFWAKQLGLSIKDCESKTGWEYEDIAINILNGRGYLTQKTSRKCAFDILVNDCVRVDVKVGRPWLLRGSRVHTFGINKPMPTCDIYMIFALDENNETERLFIVPSLELRVKTLCIGKHSKYNKFIDRWDYIYKYCTFYRSIC